jgi:ribosomal protein S18 acetylase RimI-like enzyme
MDQNMDKLFTKFSYHLKEDKWLIEYSFMKSDYEQFLEIAEENLPYLCFMVWDYFKFPNFFQLRIYKDSLLCTYENYSLFFGTPNEEIIKEFNPDGEIFISFKQEWTSLIKDKFHDFELVIDIDEDEIFNTFLCMELLKEDFRPKKEYQSRELLREDLSLLSIQRRIHLSRGFGGVGLIETNTLVGCAFASQVVDEEPFSFAIIRDVWVHPNNRNKGLGADLTSHICKIAFDNHIETIFLWVEERNYPAVHVYEKIGFKTVDRFNSAVCKMKKKS